MQWLSVLNTENEKSLTSQAGAGETRLIISKLESIMLRSHEKRKVERKVFSVNLNEALNIEFCRKYHCWHSNEKGLRF